MRVTCHVKLRVVAVTVVIWHALYYSIHVNEAKKVAVCKLSRLKWNLTRNLMMKLMHDDLSIASFLHDYAYEPTILHTSIQNGSLA